MFVLLSADGHDTAALTNHNISYSVGCSHTHTAHVHRHRARRAILPTSKWPAFAIWPTLASS